MLSPVGPAAASEGTKEVKALPIVRKLAREMGVDLGQVAGQAPRAESPGRTWLAAAPSATDDSRRPPKGIVDAGNDGRIPGVG